MDELDDDAFRNSILKHKVLVAGGQGKVKGKIFRVVYMNLCSEREISLTLTLTELILKEIRNNIELGAGVSAAQRVF